jgi:hypothetical protein
VWACGDPAEGLIQCLEGQDQDRQANFETPSSWHSHACYSDVILHDRPHIDRGAYWASCKRCEDKNASDSAINHRPLAAP